MRGGQQQTPYFFLTNKQEFYSILDSNRDELHEKLDEWQHCNNCFRPHRVHSGKTPMDRYCEVSVETTFWDEVHEHYLSENESFQN